MTATPGNLAITEGSKRMREAQLKAATEAHASVEALHKRIAGAGDAQELMMDTAYQRRLETTRQFYVAPIVSAPQVRQPA